MTWSLYTSLFLHAGSNQSLVLGLCVNKIFPSSLRPSSCVWLSKFLEQSEMISPPTPAPIQYFTSPSTATDIPPSIRTVPSCEPMVLFITGSENRIQMLIILVSILTILVFYMNWAIQRKLEQMTKALAKCHSRRCTEQTRGRIYGALQRLQDRPTAPPPYEIHGSLNRGNELRVYVNDVPYAYVRQPNGQHFLVPVRYHAGYGESGFYRLPSPYPRIHATREHRDERGYARRGGRYY